MSNYGILKKLTKSTGALLVAGMLLTHPVAFADNTANPDKVKQLFTESVEHMRARDYDKALACLDKAIELDSTKAALFGQRGTVYLNQQRFEEAITLKEVLSFDPRPGYQHDPDRVYGFAYGGYDVRFKADDQTITVVEAVPSE